MGMAGNKLSVSDNSNRYARGRKTEQTTCGRYFQ